MQPIPNNVESAFTKIFEYMALGIPQIGPDFPVSRAIIEANACGLCVDSTDPRVVADAIRYLLDHPDEARAMGQRGRAAVMEKYNWSTEAAKLLDLYARTLNGSPQQPPTHRE